MSSISSASSASVDSASVQAPLLRWTPQDRQNWIQFAKSTPSHKGTSHPYHFSKMPRLQSPSLTPADDDANNLSTCLSNAIYANDPFRIIPLAIYNLILDKMSDDPLLNYYLHFNYIRVLLKGGTAHALLFQQKDTPLFNFSDLDIAIYIHPQIPQFMTVRDAVDNVLFTVFSLHKKTLDHMLFLDHSDPIIKNRLLSDHQIHLFKSAYAFAFSQAFPAASSTIFDDKETRNLASRHSFIITPSEHDPQDTVVRIEIPHAPGCEKTPLRKSPLVYSFNDSVEINTPEYTRKFHLHRLKLNNIIPLPHLDPHVKASMSTSDSDRPITLTLTPFVQYKRIAADFIDVCVMDQNDHENISFWNNNYSIIPVPASSSAPFPLLTPELSFHLHDLHNMLHLYDCPESKRDKREKKHALFSQILQFQNTCLR